MQRNNYKTLLYIGIAFVVFLFLVNYPNNNNQQSTKKNNDHSIRPEHITSNIERLNYGDTKLESKEPPHVAVSLIVGNDVERVSKFLESLKVSDASNFDVHLFIWLSQPNGQVHKYLQEFSGFKMVLVWDPNGRSPSTTVTRILLVQEIMKDYSIEYIIEAQEDIIFTDDWFMELLMNDCGYKCGIVTPFVLQGEEPDTEELEYIAHQNSKKTVMENCEIEYPFLIKRTVIENVGYYDSKYSPSSFEKEDLQLRAIAAGYKSMHVQSSWVWYGGSHYKELKNMDAATKESMTQVFKDKNKVWPREFITGKLNRCKPVITPTCFKSYERNVFKKE